MLLPTFAPYSAGIKNTRMLIWARSRMDTGASYVCKSLSRSSPCWPHSNVVAEMTLQLNEGTASLQRAHQVYELILPGEIACP